MLHSDSVIVLAMTYFVPVTCGAHGLHWSHARFHDHGPTYARRNFLAGLALLVTAALLHRLGWSVASDCVFIVSCLFGALAGVCMPTSGDWK